MYTTDPVRFRICISSINARLLLLSTSQTSWSRWVMLLRAKTDGPKAGTDPPGCGDLRILITLIGTDMDDKVTETG